MDARATAIECSVSQTTPAPPPSGRIESAPRMQLSETLWGIRWGDVLPYRLSPEVMAVASSYEQALPFIEANYPAIFEDDGSRRFLPQQSSGAKARYYRNVGDFFEFKLETKTVGLIIGTAIDWSTYYLRSVAALPEVHGKRVMQLFMPVLFSVLHAAGIERVETDTSPSNIAMVHLLSRLRFNPSGTVLTDRWGALMKFTLFLNDEAERTFIAQFCTGIHYQLRNRLDIPKANAKGDTR